MISSIVNALVDEGSVTRLALCVVDVEFRGELHAVDVESVLVLSTVTVVYDPVRVAICAFSTSFSSQSFMFSFTNFSVN